MRDYAKKQTTRTTFRQSQFWLWAILFFIFLACVLYELKNTVLKNTITHFMAQHHSTKKSANTLLLPHPNVTAQKQIAKIKAIQKTKATSEAMEYDFYRLLPEMTVRIPSAENKNHAAPSLSQSPVNVDNFVLQVASLRQLSDAQQLQNQLKETGYSTFIQSHQSRYRVMVGPFRSLSDAQAQQLKLDEQNIEALLVKIKTG